MRLSGVGFVAILLLVSLLSGCLRSDVYAYDKLDPSVVFDISMIDNKSGAEVFTISGRDCEPTIVNRFAATLRGGS